jgi:hypothetical protein
LTLGAPYSLSQVITITTPGAAGIDVEASYNVARSSGTVVPENIAFEFPVFLDGTGAKLALRIGTVSGHSYVLQSTPALGATAVWSAILTNAGTGGVITNFVAVNPAKSQEFFRYMVE